MHYIPEFLNVYCTPGQIGVNTFNFISTFVGADIEQIVLVASF